MTSREAFLDRVRKAVAAGNRAGIVHPLPDRNGVGYQGAGSDPLERFEIEWKAAGGQLHLLHDADAARAKVLDLIQTHQVRKILLGSDPLLTTLDLQQFLQQRGLEVIKVQDLEAATSPEPFFAADIGISGVDFLIAETGSLVMRSAPNQPRSISLLPPVHIAIAERRQLVPDLFDLFHKTSEFSQDFGSLASALPSCLTLITGPSKTGDIELRLVTGVHGPGTVHVLMLDS
ncbi:MAG TPA: lactate utilization protein [Gemmataceae bacterium]|nr:lactate utilization protein [Gemmataceae bacterium]